MIRFAWRQFRFQALVVTGFLVAIAVAFLATGPHLAHLYAELQHRKTQSNFVFLSNAVTSGELSSTGSVDRFDGSPGSLAAAGVIHRHSNTRQPSSRSTRGSSSRSAQ